MRWSAAPPRWPTAANSPSHTHASRRPLTRQSAARGAASRTTWAAGGDKDRPQLADRTALDGRGRRGAWRVARCGDGLPQRVDRAERAVGEEDERGARVRRVGEQSLRRDRRRRPRRVLAARVRRAHRAPRRAQRAHIPHEDALLRRCEQLLAVGRRRERDDRAGATVGSAAAEGPPARQLLRLPDDRPGRAHVPHAEAAVAPARREQLAAAQVREVGEAALRRALRRAQHARAARAARRQCRTPTRRRRSTRRTPPRSAAADPSAPPPTARPSAR